ncbi:MAG: helicase C-terminal domain-containing protein [Candidatus Hermodarchaeota archaeon]
MYSPISNLIVHPSVRPQQQRTYEVIQDNWSNYHYFFCSLPTGSGKTDLAACLLTDYLLHNDSSDKIDILVPYRMHQDFWNEIVQKYGRKHGFSVAVLKGRGSYYCPIIKSGANISPCAFDPLYAKNCRYRQRCPLLQARKRIRRSQVRILNWWVFKYVELGEEKATFRIFDEAHNLLNLETLLRVEINYSFLSKSTQNQELLNQYTEWERNRLGNRQYIDIALDEGLQFIRDLQLVLRERELTIAESLNENPESIKLETLRDLKKISEMITALGELISNPALSDLSFFFLREKQKKQSKLIIQPFDISYIFSKLFRGSKNLFLSATIGDGEYLAKLLGLNPQFCYNIHESSSFNKDKHPFILLKEAVKLSTANKEKKLHTFQTLRDQSQIFFNLMKQKQLRGLVLASSFELSLLMEEIAKTNQLKVITHTTGKSDEAIKRFISERQGDVLISPSAWEGISLDNDLARLCLIPKLPFPMLTDPIIRKKIKKYPHFLENYVLISIQQAHGRIQRNPIDWGVTICFDGNLRWLKKKRSKSLEPWFIDRVHERTESEARILINQLVRTTSKEAKILAKSSKKTSFSRMNKEDREWLESSGLADLLKK